MSFSPATGGGDSCPITHVVQLTHMYDSMILYLFLNSFSIQHASDFIKISTNLPFRDPPHQQRFLSPLPYGKEEISPP